MSQPTTPSSTGNIEPVARFICERDFRRAGGTSEADLVAAVDRCWQVVASKIENGLVDDNNELILHDHEASLAAYRDRLKRHARPPSSK